MSKEPKKKKRRLKSLSDSLLDLDDDTIEIQQFWDSLYVLRYSMVKLERTKQKYASEIIERANAISKIKSANRLTQSDYDKNNKLINKHKLWSHIIPTDILKMIFSQFHFHQTVLQLIKTCKSWRDIITNIDPENEKILFHRLWYGCISSYFSKNIFCWKHLVLIPQKYLSLIYNLNSYQIEQMNKSENILYRKLCAKSNGIKIFNENATDSNIPLWIQILRFCPRLYTIDLNAMLSKDIFVVLNNYGKQLHHISLEYCECAEIMVHFNILGEAHLNGDTLQHLKSIHVERGCNDFDIGLFAKYFKEIQYISLEKKYVDGDILYDLFNNCTNLLSLNIWRSVSDEGDWYNAFKVLTTKNKVIQYIYIDSGLGFNDESCKLFMDKQYCPNLKTLHLGYTQCSHKMIDELIKQRQDIDIKMCCMQTGYNIF